MTTLTLEIPPEIYQRASKTATLTQQSIEQVVVNWIKPTEDEVVALRYQILAELEHLTNADLLSTARAKISNLEAERLQLLLEIQRERKLTFEEWEEIKRLVHAQDVLTLQKACAILILKQRDALPNDLRALLHIR